MVVQTLVTILFLLSSPFIILANVLIVSAYFRFKRLQTPSNALIVSLAASDLGFGLSLPIVMIHQLLAKKDYNYNYNGVSGVAGSTHLSSMDSAVTMTMTSPSTLDMGMSDLTDPSLTESYNYSIPLRPCAILLTFSVSSIFSIGAIAFDRLLSVGQPLRYNHYVTSNYVQRFLIATWFIAITIGLIPFIEWFDPPISPPSPQIVSPGQQSEFPRGGDEEDQVLVRSKEFLSWVGLLVYLPCLVCVILSYAYIYIVARGHSRAIYMVEVSLNHGDVCHLTDTSIHHHRYGLTLTFLLTIFILSWAPLFGSSILDHWVHFRILDDGQWRAAMTVPTLFSPLLNPLLYGFRSSEIRICVIRIVDSVLTRLTGRPRSIDIFQPKGELTSCASNVRLLAVSPNETTIHCCPTPTPTHEGRNHLQILLCDQTSL